jgi:hypothetical protein
LISAIDVDGNLPLWNRISDSSPQGTKDSRLASIEIKLSKAAMLAVMLAVTLEVNVCHL